MITNDAMQELIKSYCRESGVRNLQKQVEKVIPSLLCNVLSRVLVNVLKFLTLYFLCLQIKCWLLGLEIAKCLSE